MFRGAVEYTFILDADVNTVHGSFWELDVPLGWTTEHDETCLTLQRVDGIGALQISGAQKDGDVTDDDLRDFASEHLRAGAVQAAASCGEFAGLSLRYCETGRSWRVWYLRASRCMLFVTYNCAEKYRGSEDAEVDRVLGTIRRSKVG
jgi:hypothetical protein